MTGRRQLQRQAGIAGGPVSGWIMSAMGGRGGLANWQWLFLLEGIPPIVMGLVTLATVADGPADARWLADREKQLVDGINKLSQQPPTTPTLPDSDKAIKAATGAKSSSAALSSNSAT